MRTFLSNDNIYVDIRDIRKECKDYCKGIRSNSGLLERKNITDFVYGQIIDNQLVITAKLSKKLGSTFINKTEIAELFEEKEDKLPDAPPLIVDKDLIFFKDSEGNEYNVPMRGDRTKDGIFFQVKAVMKLFQMASLNNDILKTNSAHKLDEDYTWFGVARRTLESARVEQIKELYLTYAGLRKVIHNSRSGVAHMFKNWIDEIVFSSLWGTQEQKVSTISKVLNVDADHLKHIMNKSAISISCLYLLDIGLKDNDKTIYKYGFTDNVHRRFKQHMKHYGDDIKLDTFILIPVLDLSKAEAEFRNSVSRYKFIKEGEDELIALYEDSYLNTKNIFRTISDKYCGNMKSQIAHYEHEIKDLRHSYEMKLVVKDMEIQKLRSTIETKDMTLCVKDKENEILQLKIQLLQINC